MYVNTIEDILCKFMREEIAAKVQFKKPTAQNGYVSGCTYGTPNVYKGYIVAASAENTDSTEYPFVVVRVIKVFNGTRETNRKKVFARVKILFGVYCDGLDDDKDDLVPIQDGSGHTDLWDMMEMTRLKIFEQMVIEKKVTVEYEDFEMNVIEEQSVPFWHGYILMTVSMPEITPSKSFSNAFFGE